MSHTLEKNNMERNEKKYLPQLIKLNGKTQSIKCSVLIYLIHCSTISSLGTQHPTLATIIISSHLEFNTRKK